MNEIGGKPYRKPTQVGKSSRLRRSGEGCLRNSAKQLLVTSGDEVPLAIYGVGVAAKEAGRLFIKNTGPC